MRTFLFVALILVCNILPAQRYSSYVKDLPKPARVVNDFGKFLTAKERTRLEEKLVAYRKQTGNAIVIITLNTLTDSYGNTWTVEETALQYFNKWGIGDRYKNNGILILISREPRRVRITTGTGIDELLVDDECKRIIDQVMVPSFKAGKFFTGLKLGVEDIENTLDSVKLLKERKEEAQVMALRQQTQTQTQSYSTSARRPMTTGEKILIIVGLVVAVIVRVYYVRSTRAATDANGNDNTKSYGVDIINAVGWVALMLFMFVWWCCKLLFMGFGFLFSLCGRSGGGSGYYSRRGGNVNININNGGGRSYGISGGSSRSSSGGSFGGGSSSGGGASGSYGGASGSW